MRNRYEEILKRYKSPSSKYGNRTLKKKKRYTADILISDENERITLIDFQVWVGPGGNSLLVYRNGVPTFEYRLKSFKGLAPAGVDAVRAVSFGEEDVELDKIEIEGIGFDSMKEFNFYQELLLDPEVKNIRIQVPYDLGDAKNKIRYICDFVVQMRDRRMRYIDVKGFKTNTYKLKRKLMKVVHDIEIEEV